MKTINKIMVAVDFSEYSMSAARYGARLAGDVGAKRLLTNVLNEKEIDMMHRVAVEASDFSVQNYLDTKIKDRTERLEDLVIDVGTDGLELETSVRVGIPYEAPIKEIEEKQPDLLIMGTKGRSDLMDMIVGSCAQKMFRRSPIPLLSLRSVS